MCHRSPIHPTEKTCLYLAIPCQCLSRKSWNMFFFDKAWNCLCRNSTSLDYQFRNLRKIEMCEISGCSAFVFPQDGPQQRSHFILPEFRDQNFSIHYRWVPGGFVCLSIKLLGRHWVWPPSQDEIVTTKILAFLVLDPYKPSISKCYWQGATPKVDNPMPNTQPWEFPSTSCRRWPAVELNGEATNQRWDFQVWNPWEFVSQKQWWKFPRI